MLERIAGIDPVEFWGLCSLLAVGAAFGFWHGFRGLRLARLIEDTPTAKIRSAHQGYVELEGRGQPMPGEPLIAPLTTQACVWYRYTIERREDDRQEGVKVGRWKVIKEETSDALFHLLDDTGLCIVDPEGAEITTDDRLQWYGDTAWPTGAPLLGQGRAGLASGEYRYTEWLILPGQPLYALGEFRTQQPATMYSVAEQTRDLIRDWKQRPAELRRRFDADGDGQIDPAEWEAVRPAAAGQAEREYRQRLRETDLHLLAEPRDGQRPFLLSVHPQRQLSRHYRRRSLLGLASFFVLLGLLLWLVQLRLGG